MIEKRQDSSKDSGKPGLMKKPALSPVTCEALGKSRHCSAPFARITREIISASHHRGEDEKEWTHARC